MPPIISTKDTFFFWIKVKDIRILISTKNNSNAMLIFTFLHSFKDLLMDFMKRITASAVRDNVIVIYEIMDEIVDDGCVQQTDYNLLKQYITSTANYIKKNRVKSKKNSNATPVNVNSQIPWRTGKYDYVKNEVYLDVVEKINMVTSASGQVIKSEVDGSLEMKCRLSGTPELVLGINDEQFFRINKDKQTSRKTVAIKDMKFHQCVRLAKFENDRTISFVPPDGKFQLIGYKIDSPQKPLFTVQMDYTHQGQRKIMFNLKIATKYKSKIKANFIEFYIPVHPQAQAIKCTASKGKAKHFPEKSVIKWALYGLAGRKEIELFCKFELSSLDVKNNNYKKLPITAKFEIPYYIFSGLSVRYLKIKE